MVFPSDHVQGEESGKFSPQPPATAEHEEDVKRSVFVHIVRIQSLVGLRSRIRANDASHPIFPLPEGELFSGA